MFTNKKGFTLLELLIVVLIIGILSAVALPGYRKSVEKSRVADALTTMQTVAKSEHDWYLRKNNYTKDFSDLDIDLTDKNGNKADNATFKTDLYTYELLDTGIIADRNNGEYSLYKDYDSQQILCTPGTHYICEDLGTFTQVPCEKIGMVWANTNYTCYANNEDRCKDLYGDSMWHNNSNPSNSYCGYTNKSTVTINEGMVCIGDGGERYACQYSTVNYGGVCSARGWAEVCNYSTINAGGVCEVTAPAGCNDITVNGGECKGNSQVCQHSTFNGGKCVSGGTHACRYSTFSDGAICTGSCVDVTITNGARCEGVCSNIIVSKGGVCTGIDCGGQIQDGGICVSNSSSSSRCKYSNYSGTGCCCGDYCDSRPKCSAERCAAI